MVSLTYNLTGKRPNYFKIMGHWQYNHTRIAYKFWNYQRQKVTKKSGISYDWSENDTKGALTNENPQI
jgi:hypothetical protein